MAITGDASPDVLTRVVEAAFPAATGTLPVQRLQPVDWRDLLPKMT